LSIQTVEGKPCLLLAGIQTSKINPHWEMPKVKNIGKTQTAREAISQTEKSHWSFNSGTHPRQNRWLSVYRCFGASVHLLTIAQSIGMSSDDYQFWH
jgi:hypothetical protein